MCVDCGCGCVTSKLRDIEISTFVKFVVDNNFKCCEIKLKTQKVYKYIPFNDS